MGKLNFVTSSYIFYIFYYNMYCICHFSTPTCSKLNNICCCSNRNLFCREKIILIHNAYQFFAKLCRVSFNHLRSNYRDDFYKLINFFLRYEPIFVWCEENQQPRSFNSTPVRMCLFNIYVAGN